MQKTDKAMLGTVCQVKLFSLNYYAYTTLYMGLSLSGGNARVDIGDLVIFNHPQYVGDTFIFEPSPEEKGLGRLLAAAETEDRDGLGKELLDMVIHALQREYYRDPARGILASFESALHQVNLVLHEAVEQGIRDWMGSLHVAVGVLAGKTLHVSTAGKGVVLLVRKSRVTIISTGLSHSPITNPLRTFSQVASGIVIDKDKLFFGTSELESTFHHKDIARLTADHSATTIVQRLQQLYEDRDSDSPLAVLAVSVLPKHIAQTANSPSLDTYERREPVSTIAHLKPRAPIDINRSLLKQVLLLGGRVVIYLWRNLRRVVWPFIKKGSRRSGSALYQASYSAQKNVRSITAKTIRQWRSGRAKPVKMGGVIDNQDGKYTMSLAPRKISLRQVQAWPKQATVAILGKLKLLPKSSKVFAVVALVLAIALGTSLVLLQKKRVEDAQFQEASELLHEARTKKDAAETALIYDNREQARGLLQEAKTLTEQLASLDLYQEQTGSLQSDITSIQDRLDKVVRVSTDELLEVGDFGSVMVNKFEPLKKIFFLSGSLYSFDPANNNILKMSKDGEVLVSNQTTQGVGYIVSGVSQEADKSLVLITDAPEIVLYDTKTSMLHKQEMEFPSDNPRVYSVSVYGNRLYIYDRSANNIYGYSKTLRGYSDGNAWIKAEDFPAETVRSIGVDGYIYTLHEDGTINKLLKGSPVDFALEKIEPAISESAELLIDENLRHLYVFDPQTRRVAIFDTKGNLNRQVFLGENSGAVDIAVDVEETTLYVLDGTKIMAVSLVE